MQKTNLRTQMEGSVKHLTNQDLPVELAELLEKDLQHIIGGRQHLFGFDGSDSTRNGAGNTGYRGRRDN